MSLMRMLRRMAAALSLVLLTVLSLTSAALAQDPSDVKLDQPIRSFTFDPSKTKIDFNLDFFNFADSRRLVTMKLLDVPDGWDVAVWNAFFDFKISEIVVEPNESTPGQRPSLRVQLPDPRPAPGEYSFTLVLTDTENPNLEYDRAKFTVGVPEAAPADIGEVTARADYAVLRGPSNTSYGFEVILKNDTDNEQSLNLDATTVNQSGQPLQGWTVTFTPTFGEQKQISSISILANNEERVNVNVTPPSLVAAGNYLIPVSAATDDDAYKTGIVLGLQIVGHGNLTAATETGRLTMDATAGEAATNTLRLTNYGTADLNNIALSFDAPEGWDVGFQVPTVASLPVNNQIDVNVTITPPDNAKAGDYVVTLAGETPDTMDSIDLRVTVDRNSIWGWVGFALVLVFVSGVLGVFWRLSRR